MTWGVEKLQCDWTTRLCVITSSKYTGPTAYHQDLTEPPPVWKLSYSFSSVAPRLWNSLPAILRGTDDLEKSKTALKHTFSQQIM